MRAPRGACRERHSRCRPCEEHVRESAPDASSDYDDFEDRVSRIPIHRGGGWVQKAHVGSWIESQSLGMLRGQDIKPDRIDKPDAVGVPNITLPVTADSWCADPPCCGTDVQCRATRSRVRAIVIRRTFLTDGVYVRCGATSIANRTSSADDVRRDYQGQSFYLALNAITRPYV
ncbi:hypothetical protein LX36DRAFT_291142 [Colletotrichum falcatum]|nr:hypothetical protein LX36DRAFT_291142 [Colletotrichum falcatum]